MKKIYLLLFAAGLLAGCAARKAPDVMTYYDPYTRSRTDFIPENMLESEGPPREVVWLNASRIYKNRKDFQYFLEVEYLALPETGFLDIQPGESLVILADRQELKFNSSGSLNARKEREDEVRERAIYPVTADELRAIADAEKVKVSIIGRNGIVQREFKAANTQRFKEFVAQYASGW